MTDLQKEILSLFAIRQTVELATCEGQQPRIRPMTLIFHQQRFFVATGTADDKAKQIQENPFTEIIYLIRTDNSSGYVRISGIMNNITDPILREEVADISGFIHDFWEDSQDSSFLLLEIIPREAQLLYPGDMNANKIVWESIH